jgi:Zn-dependent peptidase ImmA (M78 family)
MSLPNLAAEQILNKLKITSPEDLQFLESIAWERGATVIDKPLSGSEARLVVVDNRAIITVSTSIKNSRRRRFGIAHELGHLELHRRHSNVTLCASQDLNDWLEQRSNCKSSVEQQANEFAAALLLPKRFVEPVCKNQNPSFEIVTEIAETFNVSLTATAIRYLAFCEEACAVVFSQNGYIQWFRGSEEFKNTEVFVAVRSKLDPSSQAASFFRGRTIRSDFKQVKASTWFKPGRYRDDATILEQSLAMPNYGAVLTMLWIDDDIEDDDEFWL